MTIGISVVMPMYNASLTIADAVRSTLRALPQDAELVIVDDGSSDASASIVRGVADQRIRLLLSDENRGVAQSLNKGLAASRGIYVARMDADDLCLPWRFCSQLRQLKRSRSDLHFGSYLYFGAGVSTLKPPPIFSLSQQEMAAALAVCNPVAHSTMMARRAALPADPYVDGPAEDYHLWLRLARDGRQLSRSSIPVPMYRLHRHQVTRSVDWWSRYNSDTGLQEEVRRYRHALGWQDPPESGVDNADLERYVRRHFSWYVRRQLVRLMPQAPGESDAPL